jgi:hypothetical protein
MYVYYTDLPTRIIVTRVAAGRSAAKMYGVYGRSIHANGSTFGIFGDRQNKMLEICISGRAANLRFQKCCLYCQVHAYGVLYAYDLYML